MTASEAFFIFMHKTYRNTLGIEDVKTRNMFTKSACTKLETPTGITFCIQSLLVQDSPTVSDVSAITVRVYTSVILEALKCLVLLLQWTALVVPSCSDRH